jgi:ATP-binding protein involved in chromosome partitioning
MARRAGVKVKKDRYFMALTRDQVVSALRTVQDPELLKDLVTLGMIKEIHVEASHARVVVEVAMPTPAKKEKIEADVKSALRRAGAESVEVILVPVRGPGQPGSPGMPGGQPQRPSPLPQVKNIIAVGAGKGGVGKSTIAVNLAVGLHRDGARVGVMDGDIYGPSIPTLLGLKGRVPPMRGNKIMPHESHGLSAITIGSLVEEDKPLIWRGPMAHGAFKQLLLDNTDWPDLDYLIVDLPPGTGDVPLTLCQLLPLTGAVVVATPQQVALDDAVRAVRMFQQLGAPILGLVENMSYFIAPDGSEHDIFGRGGTERCAQRLGLTYLGGVPMFTELRVNSDAGNPTANFNGHPKLREALELVTRNLASQVSARNLAGAGPVLTIC